MNDKNERDTEVAPGRWARIEATLGGEWIALVNGYQVGGPIDPALGCGTATYPTAGEAWQAAREVATVRTSERDAGLIAAAPTMLAALQAILAALTQNATFPADVELARINARSAIAAATKAPGA